LGSDIADLIVSPSTQKNLTDGLNPTFSVSRFEVA